MFPIMHLHIFSVMWKELIQKNGGELTNDLDLSSLAKISDGYTQGHMVQVVRSILTERRVQQLPKRPLTASEFVLPLARIDPVFQEEEEALKVSKISQMSDSMASHCTLKLIANLTKRFWLIVST